jgi:hypothetical protein
MGSILGNNDIKLDVSIDTTSIVYIGITILLAVAIGVMISSLVSKIF